MSAMRGRVLYGVSGIGLGHATRSSVVVRKLQEMGSEVKLVTGGNAASFFKEDGFDPVYSEPPPEPRVVDGEMKDAFLWYVRSWRALRRGTGEIERFVEEFQPDVVVGDEEFATISAGMKSGLPTAMISDELELGFAHSWLARKAESRAMRWYKGIQDGVELLIVPSAGQDIGNVRFVGPIVRPLTRSAHEVRTEYSLPGRFVLLSMSGTGIGRHLLGGVRSSLKELGGTPCHLVIAGNRGDRVEGEGIYDLGVVQNNQDIIAVADLVVSTAGKSTIDEALCYGTPVVPVPIRNHAEQERNAAELEVSPDDIDNLGNLIARLLGKRTPPVPSSGADRAAALIHSLFQKAV